MHDYHMHSHWCRHASGSLEEYARAAAERGLEEICFTPHIPLPGFRPGFFNDKLHMDLVEFDAYEEELARTRALFPSLSILSGVEADYIEGRERFVEGFLAAHEFDLVLMSVHFVAAWPEDCWVFELPRDRPLELAYADYFRCVREGIATGLYDSIAHLDLIKRPGLPVLEVCRDEVEDTLARCAAAGMSLELNTSGTRKAIAECYPAPALTALAVERGLRITPGSDAHAPHQVGLSFDAPQAWGGERTAAAFVRYRRRRTVAAGTGDQLFCSTKLR